MGTLGIILTRNNNRDLKPRYMFVLTVSSWFIIALLSALPFYLSDNGISAADAVFEGTSGITTTGATVFTGLDRKSTRLNSSHVRISYAVFCLKKKTYITRRTRTH